MKYLTTVDWIALLLLSVGGVNWGLIALFDFNLVSALFGNMTTASRVVYSLVAAAALYLPVSMMAAAVDEATYTTTTRKVIT